MPFCSHVSIVSKSRMPPPSWDGDRDGGEDCLHRGVVDRLACEGAVQVDDVQVLKSLLLEGARLRRRVVVEHGRGLHLAELQAHALAVLEVDGGKEDQGALLSGRLSVAWGLQGAP